MQKEGKQRKIKEISISCDTQKEGSESMNLDELEKLAESIEVL